MMRKILSLVVLIAAFALPVRAQWIIVVTNGQLVVVDRLNFSNTPTITSRAGGGKTANISNTGSGGGGGGAPITWNDGSGLVGVGSNVTFKSANAYLTCAGANVGNNTTFTFTINTGAGGLIASNASVLGLSPGGGSDGQVLTRQSGALGWTGLGVGGTTNSWGTNLVNGTFQTWTNNDTFYFTNDLTQAAVFTFKTSGGIPVLGLHSGFFTNAGAVATGYGYFTSVSGNTTLTFNNGIWTNGMTQAGTLNGVFTVNNNGTVTGLFSAGSISTPGLMSASTLTGDGSAITGLAGDLSGTIGGATVTGVQGIHANSGSFSAAGDGAFLVKRGGELQTTNAAPVSATVTNAFIAWNGDSALYRAPSTATPSAPYGTRLVLNSNTSFGEFRAFLPTGWTTNCSVSMRLMIPVASSGNGTVSVAALGWKTAIAGDPNPSTAYYSTTNIGFTSGGTASNILAVAPTLLNIFTNTAAGDQLWLKIGYVSGVTSEVDCARIDYR